MESIGGETEFDGLSRKERRRREKGEEVLYGTRQAYLREKTIGWGGEGGKMMGSADSLNDTSCKTTQQCRKGEDRAV